MTDTPFRLVRKGYEPGEVDQRMRRLQSTVDQLQIGIGVIQQSIKQVPCNDEQIQFTKGVSVRKLPTKVLDDVGRFGVVVT